MMRRPIVWLIVLTLALAGGPLLGPRPARADLVRWTDDKGEVHIGELDDVPDRYKKAIKPLGSPEEPTAPACLAAKDAPKGGAKIRFKPNVSGRIYVWACINGKGPVAMILDIGAFATVIREPVLKGFGVEFTETMVGHGGVGFSEAAPLAKLQSLQVEGARVGPLYIIATKDTRFSWEQHGPHNIVGLLGQDFLKEFFLDIDNQRGIVVLTPKTRVGGGTPAKQAPAAAPKGNP
jgi:hypothetical protein